MKKKQGAQRICRSYNIEDIQTGENEITGHAVVFNQTTDIGGMFSETIRSEALNSCDLTDVFFFTNHDTLKIPLARSRRNNPNSTMQLQVTEKGLFFRANIDVEKNAEASSLYSAVGRGDVTGMSFMMYIDGEEWEGLDTEYPVRTITSIGQIAEISAVNFPAYAGTDIQARSASTLDNEKKALERAREALTLESVKRVREKAFKKSEQMEKRIWR